MCLFGCGQVRPFKMNSISCTMLLIYNDGFHLEVNTKFLAMALNTLDIMGGPSYFFWITKIASCTGFQFPRSFTWWVSSKCHVEDMSLCCISKSLYRHDTSLTNGMGGTHQNLFIHNPFLSKKRITIWIVNVYLFIQMVDLKTQ